MSLSSFFQLVLIYNVIAQILMKRCEVYQANFWAWNPYTSTLISLLLRISVCWLSMLAVCHFKLCNQENPAFWNNWWPNLRGHFVTLRKCGRFLDVREVVDSHYLGSQCRNISLGFEPPTNLDCSWSSSRAVRFWLSSNRFFLFLVLQPGIFLFRYDPSA